MKQKIIVKARFAPLAKTLAEWQNENPILLVGEHGVVADSNGAEKEKIGDGVTPWNELDWWKGLSAYEIAVINGFEGTEKEWLASLKGEKGDKGENGDTPTIDQTYNAESENAQSGVAVAEAVNGLVPKITTYDAGAPFDSLLAIENADVNYETMMPNDSAYRYLRAQTADFFGKDIDAATYYSGVIPVRDSNGNLWTGAPVDDVDCANKVYVDKQFSNLNIKNGADGTYGIYQESEKDDNNITLKFTDLPIDDKTNIAGSYDRSALGTTAAAFGSSVASGYRSLAAGSSNVAAGGKAVALGCDNYVSGVSGFATGYANYVSGECATSFGCENKATAFLATTFGTECEATGDCSFASGSGTKATAIHATAIGNRINAGYENQCAVGKFNKNANDTFFEVGNGTDENNRNTAFAVLKDGNSIRIGSTTVTEEQLKKLLALIG